MMADVLSIKGPSCTPQLVNLDEVILTVPPITMDVPVEAVIATL